MASFDDCIGPTLANEGGLVEDPNDPGGLTKYGISSRAYPHVDIRNLTVEGAKAIYERDYWEFDGLTSQAVACKLFDMSVNIGRLTAVSILQRILGLSPDGAYGPMTEAGANASDPSLLLSELRSAMADFYRALVEKHPQFSKFLQGWLRRAAS